MRSLLAVVVLLSLVTVASLAAAHGDEEDDHFDTGELARGFSATHTFDQIGTFRYSCKYHPDTMRGTFTVVEGATDGDVLLELVDQRIRHANETHTDLKLTIARDTVVEVVNREEVKHRLVQAVAEDSSGPALLLLPGALALLAVLRRRT